MTEILIRLFGGICAGQVRTMRRWLAVALMALLCASCTFGRAEKSTRHWPKINWDVQTPVLESRKAWDEATDRNNEYEGAGNQLAH